MADDGRFPIPRSAWLLLASIIWKAWWVMDPRTRSSNTTMPGTKYAVDEERMGHELDPTYVPAAEGAEGMLDVNEEKEPLPSGRHKKRTEKQPNDTSGTKGGGEKRRRQVQPSEDNSKSSFPVLLLVVGVLFSWAAWQGKFDEMFGYMERKVKKAEKHAGLTRNGKAAEKAKKRLESRNKKSS